ncbi:hypothetical protein K227x_03680 [Rubripirellula lacrimiformis]|uniref:Secreted protein n=1 Tax=Rubripirellula lacrimiformis TaxID=1930273 RepID=A0A517N4D8_9BACT|nr:hypothetical protein [Rubripirellula lacrimiformis]QDT01997.1 hypothetical protein K227x_03680 [Rubripirellula lacrimiformis]
MKKFCLIWIAVFSVSTFSLVGCGGSGGDTEVIREVPEEEPEMTAAESAAYEKSMRESTR